MLFSGASPTRPPAIGQALTKKKFNMWTDLIKLLLTECNGCSGEYWPEVAAVQTKCSEVCTKTTKDHPPQSAQASKVIKQFSAWQSDQTCFF